MSANEAVDLSSALQRGIERGLFTNRIVVMRLMQFARRAIEQIDGLGEPNYNRKTGVPFCLEFNILKTYAIVKWIDSKPAYVDLMKLFTANYLTAPELDGSFTFNKPKQHDSGRIINALWSNGYLRDLASLLQYTQWVGTGQNLPPYLVTELKNQITDFSQLRGLFEAASFDGKILLVVNAIQKHRFRNAEEMESLVRPLFDEVESENRLVAQSKETLSQESWAREQATADRMNEAFNWLGYVFADSFSQLGATETQLAYFRHEMVLTPIFFDFGKRYLRHSSALRRKLWILQGQPLPAVLREAGFKAPKMSLIDCGQFLLQGGDPESHLNLHNSGK